MFRQTSVMVRGFNVNQNPVHGFGDRISEQSRALLQVENICTETGGESALLESRDLGYFVVNMPNFWERPEVDGYLRNVCEKPVRYEWLRKSLAMAVESQPPLANRDLLGILKEVRGAKPFMCSDFFLIRRNSMINLAAQLRP